MFKFRNKNTIEPTTKEANLELAPPPYDFKNPQIIASVNKKIFDKIISSNHQKDDIYLMVNNKKFQHLLLTKQYVDAKYIALQIYLLQEDADGFKYWEIKNFIVKIIQFIELLLLEGKTICFAQHLYIGSNSRTKIIINNKTVPRVTIFKSKPQGPIFSLEDIDCNLQGIREFALFKLIINNFDQVLLNLLKRIGQILLGNLIIMQMGVNYAVVVSEQFLLNSSASHDLVKTLSIAQTKKLNHPNVPLTPILKRHKAIYKTQQIFVPKDDEKYLQQITTKIDKNNLHATAKKVTKRFKKIHLPKQEKIKKPDALLKEIEDINKRLETAKEKKAYEK